MQIEPYKKHFGRDKRQPFQFSLRALMLVTAACAAVAAIFSRWRILGLFMLLLGLAVFQIGRGIWTRRIDRVAGGGCAILLLFVISIPAFSVALWIGNKTYAVPFVVTDGASGGPIPGAIVRIRQTWMELPPLNVPAGEPGVQGATRSDGGLVLNNEFQTGGRDSLLEQSAYVHISPEFLLQVTAKGYVPYRARLETLVGRSRDHDYPFPSPLKIELVAEPAQK